MIIKEKHLYERYSARLLAVCQRYLGDRAWAEDVLHDSFITIFNKSGKFDFRGEAALYGWMRSITVHKCIDALRAARRGPVPLDEGRDIPEEAGPDADGVRKIPPGELIRMIGELPDGYRTVFNLFCMEGYSHAEIAEKLGIRENTSTSQYFRARALLAKKIKDYLENEQEDQ